MCSPGLAVIKLVSTIDFLQFSMAGREEMSSGDRAARGVMHRPLEDPEGPRFPVQSNNSLPMDDCAPGRGATASDGRPLRIEVPPPIAASGLGPTASDAYGPLTGGKIPSGYSSAMEDDNDDGLRKKRYRGEAGGQPTSSDGPEVAAASAPSAYLSLHPSRSQSLSDHFCGWHFLCVAGRGKRYVVKPTASNPLDEIQPEADGEAPVEPSAVVPVSIELSAETIGNLLEDLGKGDPDIVYNTLYDLRELLLANGVAAQLQIARDDRFVRVLVDWLHADPSPHVVGAAARVLCSLVAKNPSALAVICVDSIVGRLLKIVAISVDHHRGSACRHCNGPPLSTDVSAPSDRPRFSTNPCPSSFMGCSALWAVCAMTMKNPVLQKRLAHDKEAIVAITHHLSSVNEEAVQAAAWTLCNIVMGNPSLVPTVLSEAAPSLVDVINGGVETAKGLACWAIRAFAVHGSTSQEELVTKGALKAVLDLILRDERSVRAPVSTATLAAGVWALGALVNGVKDLQDCVRTGARVGITEGVALDKVIELLSHPSPQVHIQVAGAVHNIAARNEENQTYLGAGGALEKLVAMLPAAQGTVRVVEKAVVAMLSLTLKHPVNQQRLTRLPGCAYQVVRYLGCNSSRIQGLAAGLVRTVVSDQPDLASLMASHGALSYASELSASKDAFAQEQACAALYNLIGQQPLNKPWLLLLEPEDKLVPLLADCTKPTRLAYTCSIMILYALSDFSEEYKTKLQEGKHAASLTSSLLRLCHPGCTDLRLRGQADRLLRTLYLDAHSSRVTGSALSVLDSLHTFTASRSLHCRCVICAVDDEATTPGGEMVFLPCCHVYHVQCLRGWFGAGKDTCPECRASVLTLVNKLTGVDVTTVVGK